MSEPTARQIAERIAWHATGQCGCAFLTECEAMREHIVAEHVATLTADLAQARQDGPPGVWICETCHFVLIKSVLRASDGAVGVDRREVHDVCPNDGTSMRRQTWKEACESAEQVARQQMERATEALQARDAALENGADIHFAAGFLLKLKAECEQQHARAEAAEAQLSEARRQGEHDAFMAGFLAAPRMFRDNTTGETVRAGWRFDVEGQPMAADLAEPAYAAWLRQRARPSEQTEAPRP